MTERELEISDEVRVVTENSVWLLRPDEYCRLPRREQPRRAPSPLLTDAVWHPHVGVWLVTDAFGSYLRLMPAGLPPGAHGVMSGVIVASSLTLLANDGGDPSR